MSIRLWSTTEVVSAFSPSDSTMEVRVFGDDTDDKVLFRVNAEGRVEVESVVVLVLGDLLHVAQIPLV